MTQGDRPDWRPLQELVGDRVTGDFMWMYEVELSDGSSLQAYKHIDTRRYIHLDAGSAAFAYESPGRYREVPAADVLAEVFADLPRLADVTTEQVEASLQAVKRLREAGEAA
jgi:hypothetical protein